jgi:type VI secretion system Hcp family effector
MSARGLLVVPWVIRRPRKLATVVLVGVGLGLLTPGAASAAVDNFLFIPTVAGESPDPLHKGWIEFRQGTFKFARATRSASPAYAPFTLTKNVDSSTPRFLAAVGSGTVIPNAWLYLRKSGGSTADYFKIQFSNVAVLSDQINFPEDDSGPIETIALSYTRAVESYAPQTSTGALGTPLIFGWSTYNQTPYNIFTEVPTNN